MNLIGKHYKQIILVIGFFFFSFLFYLSWIFFKERMLNFDSSFFSFLIINSKEYNLPHGRWGGVFTQLLPLTALKNNCSLETFLRLYSISPIILYFIIFGIITLGLQNYRAGIALILSLCLAFRHVFYYTVVELHLGIAISILFWTLISPETECGSLLRKRIAYGISLLLIYVMLNLHPLTLFIIVFIVIAEFLANKRYKDIYLWTVFSFALLCYLIGSVLAGSEYESEQMVSLSVFFEQLPHLRYLPSTNYFKAFAPNQLWSTFLVFLIGWIYLFRMKNWLYLIFLPTFSIFFLVLILITYYKGEAPIRYENYYTLLGVFAAVSFTFIAFKMINKCCILIFLIPLLLLNLKGIYNGHDILTKRIEYIDHLVAYGRKQENKKYLINAVNYPWQIAWISWGLPFETLLYSSLEHPDSAVTFFVTPDMNKYDSLVNQENIFLGPEWAVTWFKSNSINQDYFHLPSTGYQKLNTSQNDSTFMESEFTNQNIQLSPVKEIYYSDSDSFLMAPVVIKNLTGKKLASTLLGRMLFF